MTCQRVGGFPIRWFTITAAIVALAFASCGGSSSAPTKVGNIDTGVVLASVGSTINVKPHHNHRYLVAMRLKRGLAGTPLEHEYWTMELWGHRWNVSPYLVAGIAGTESGFGAATCGGDDAGNAWGIASCIGTSFATFADGIRFTTRLLRLDYLNDGLTDLDAIGGRYAACGSCWADATAGHMHRFGASGDWLTYPG